MNTTGPHSSRAVAPAQRRSVSRLGLACQLFPAVGLIATVVVMLIASQPGRGESTIGDLASIGGFLVWGILPFVGLGIIVVLTDRLARPRLWITAVGGFALLAFTAWSFADFFRSDSSTSALVFVFLPLIQWTAVITTGVVILVIATLRPAKDGR